MDKLNKLFEDISKIKTKYDKEREKNRFNIFTAMYRTNEEVKLHSRVISYLLCSKSGHGMENIFFKLFLTVVLKLNENEVDVNNYEVKPNEIDKREYKNIDILITDKKRAVIVENKIDAGDSNDPDAKPGYKGQLDRYYNTIKTGVDKNDKEDFTYQRNSVYVYYLSKGNPPLKESIEEILKNNPDWKGVVSYGSEIGEWLDKCINEIPSEKSSVKEFVQHYLNLINKMTHNDINKEERLNLKQRVAENWESTKYLIDHFKHVKWHTVHEFWIELEKKIKEHYNSVKLFPDNFDSTITQITHQSKNENHGITFEIKNGMTAYISGAGKLSWGVLEGSSKKWADFKQEMIENIIFSDFSTEKTYRLIDKKNMEDAVKTIIEEIKEEQINNFKNLSS